MANKTSRPFCHLHCHTDRSMLDGVGRSAEYAELAAGYGHTHLAVTDHGNLYGLPEHARACNEHGIHPVFGCLLRGQEILTSRGVVPVEKIVVGDLVLTHTGRFLPVTRTMSRVHDGPMYRVRLAGRYPRDLVLTGDHPIMIRRYNGDTGWVDAGEVLGGRTSSRKGVAHWYQYACLPKLVSSTPNPQWYARHLPTSWGVEKNGVVTKFASVKGSRDIEWSIAGLSSIDPELAYFLGLFAAEGSVRHVRGRVNGAVSLCFGLHEPYPEIVASFLRDRLGIKSSIHRREHKWTAEVIFTCLPIAHILKSMFGHGAKNKRVPAEIYAASRESRRQFIAGLWDGDGTSKKTGQRVLHTSSISLAWGARALLADLGHWAGMTVTKKGSLFVSFTDDRAWSRTLEDDRYVYRPIKSVIKTPRRRVRVYNFAVQGDESYVSDFVLHNCEFYVNNERDQAAQVLRGKAKKEAIAAGTADPTFTDAHLNILAQTDEGWRNLLWLNHDSVINGYYYKPRTTHPLVLEHNAGLIATTACIGSMFGQYALMGKTKELRKLLADFRDAFGRDRFFYELHFNELDDQKKVNAVLIQECTKLGIDPVLASDTHYACGQDAERQDEMIAVARHKPLSDPDAFRLTARNLWFCEPEDAFAFSQRFGYGMDKAKFMRAADNAQRVAQSCTAEIYGDGVLRPPVYLDDTGNPVADAYEHLKKLAVAGFQELFKHRPPHYGALVERLKHELRSIRKIGVADFYLVTMDVVDQCRRRGVFVWTRGSGCASLVAMALGITQIDPVRFKLLFERFLDPDRPNAPDFDLDIAADRRDEIIEWMVLKYGGNNGERIARICLLQTFGLKAAIRDICYAHGVDPGLAKAASKTVDKLDPSVEHSLAECGVAERSRVHADALAAIVAKGDLRTNDLVHRYPGTMAAALTMVGRVRGKGQHAAGYVVAPDALVNHIPIDKASGEVVTAWGEGQASQDISGTGLFKIDMLGLEMGTVIDRCIRAVAKRHNRPEADIRREIDPQVIDFTDPRVQAEYVGGNGFGIHQLQESSQQLAQLIARLRPKVVDDVIAAIALYRPGSVDFMDDFVARARGQASVPSVHPLYDAAVADTYGIIVYQEQIMEILHLIGGIPRREAYNTIKHISKKKLDKIKKGRDDFVAGAQAHGLTQQQAETIFDVIEKFAGYGFNRAHATSYGVMSWQTAHLRAYYPTEYWWSLLCSNPNKSAGDGEERKLELVMRAATRAGMSLLPPALGLSRSRWKITPKGRLLAPLTVVLGVPKKAADMIADRHASQPFRDEFDFLSWLDGTKCGLGPPSLVSLAQAGAFRSFGTAPEVAYDIATAWGEAVPSKHATRTEIVKDRLAKEPDKVFLTVADGDTRMAMERRAMGFAFWCNPWSIDARAVKVSKLIESGRIAPDEDKRTRGKRRAFYISSIRNHTDKKGGSMAFLSLQTMTGGNVKSVCFASTWEKVRRSVRSDGVYLIAGDYDDKGEYMVGPAVRDRSPFRDVDTVELAATP